MDSSDEDFLPDPEKYNGKEERRKEPPDRGGVGDEEPSNKQRGLKLHDDFSKGKCSFFYFSDMTWISDNVSDSCKIKSDTRKEKSFC